MNCKCKIDDGLYEGDFPTITSPLCKAAPELYAMLKNLIDKVNWNQGCACDQCIAIGETKALMDEIDEENNRP